MRLDLADRAEAGLGHRGDRGVDEGEDRAGRAEGMGERQSLEGQAPLVRGPVVVTQHLARAAAEIALSGQEIDGAGALEAEDRLLPVADREQRPRRRRVDAAADEELVGERTDDAPLLRVGVLRLVDQHVLGDLVELVADPFADAGLFEQREGDADQVVEVDAADAALGAVVGAGIVAADLERGGEEIGMARARGERADLGAFAAEFGGELGIVGLGGEELGGCLARLALAGQDHAGERVERREACRGVAREPAANRVGMGETRGRRPHGVGVGEAADRVGVERGATLRQHLVDVPRRQVQLAADIGLDPGRQRLQRGERAGAFGEELLGPALPQPERQRADRAHGAVASFALGGGQHLGQRLAPQHRLLARLERAEAGDQSRLDRKGGEQPLAEAVDGLDAQAAAGRVEHLGEERAGAGALRRVAGLAQRLQIAAEIGIGHPHPGGEPVGYALCHLRGARLGEGEAQSRGRLHALQQQAEDARGQDLRLARTRRGAEPDMRVGVGRARLLALEGRQWAEAALSAHGRTIRRGASAGRNRHRSRIRASAWR